MNNKIFKAMSILFALIFVFCFTFFVLSCSNLSKPETNSTDSETNSTHEHCFEEWTIAKRATCTEEGIRERYCSCGEKQTAYLSSLGHDFVSHDGQLPSCTQDGWHEYRTCSRCDFNDFRTISSLGHEFGEWEISEASSCIKQGKEKRVCLRCKTYSETRDLQTIEHTESVWITEQEPACENNGLKIKKCTVCGEVLETEEIPALGHDFGEWTQTEAPNCTDTGVEMRICKRNMLHAESRKIDALGHNYEWNCNADGHSKLCTECGNETELAPHEWNNGACGICGFEKPAVSELSFERIGDTYTVTGIGTVQLTEIEIPSEYNGLPVTAIAAEAFKDSTLTKIIIPDSVKKIGVNAFLGCTITYVVFETLTDWQLYEGDNWSGNVTEEFLEDAESASLYLTTFSSYTWINEIR